jgi:hypothetical protein
MSRTLRAVIAATALLGAVPAAASADTVKGTVVARDAVRGTIVTAGSGGAVATLRVAKPASFKPGARVRANATPLADGTYRGAGVKRLGRAKAVAVRGTLVRRSGRELLLAAGGSTFAVRTARPAVSGAPGALVSAKLKVAKGRLTAHKVRLSGQATMLEIEGTIASFDGATLQIAVEAPGTVPVAVPAGVELTAGIGDEVEVVVAVGAGFTLLAVDGEIDVAGTITAVSPGSITIGAVTCAVPEYLDVGDLLTGDPVFATCLLSGGTLTLDEIEFDEPSLGDEPGEEPYDEDEDWSEEDDLVD